MRTFVDDKADPEISSSSNRLVEQIGALSYSTGNVGDDIQSLAAQAFLPSPEVFIDREALADVELSQDTLLIGNAWYLHDPRQWPPNPNVHLVPIAMHIDSTKEVREAFSTASSTRYLNQMTERFGPIGCRDLATVQFLEGLGLDAYFSGCVTLTLQENSALDPLDIVLAVDTPSAVEHEIRRVSPVPVVAVSPVIPTALPSLARRRYALLLLHLYQRSRVVFTSRLHAALPSLALGTPVVYTPNRRVYSPGRFSGLKSFLNVLDDVSSVSALIASPTPNSGKHIEVRTQIVDRLSEITGRLPRTMVPSEDIFGNLALKGLDDVEALSSSLEDAYRYRSLYASEPIRRASKDTLKSIFRIR